MATKLIAQNYAQSVSLFNGGQLCEGRTIEKFEMPSVGKRILNCFVTNIPDMKCKSIEVTKMMFITGNPHLHLVEKYLLFSSDFFTRYMYQLIQYHKERESSHASIDVSQLFNLEQAKFIFEKLRKMKEPCIIALEEQLPIRSISKRDLEIINDLKIGHSIKIGNMLTGTFIVDDIPSSSTEMIVCVEPKCECPQEMITIPGF